MDVVYFLQRLFVSETLTYIVQAGIKCTTKGKMTLNPAYTSRRMLGSWHTPPAGVYASDAEVGVQGTLHTGQAFYPLTCVPALYGHLFLPGPLPGSLQQTSPQVLLESTGSHACP